MFLFDIIELTYTMYEYINEGKFMEQDNKYTNGTNAQTGGNNPPQENSNQQYNQNVGNNNPPQQQYYNPAENGNPQQQYYQPPVNNNQQQYYQGAGNGNPQGQYYQPPVNNPGMPQPPIPQPPKKKKTGKIIGTVIGVILGLIVLCFVGLFIIGLVVGDEESVDTSVSESQSQKIDETEEQAETEEQTEAEEEAKDFAMGTVSDGTYKNSFAGLELKLPGDEWEFLDNDSVFEMLQSSDAKQDENGAVYIETEAETAYYDVMMLNNSNGTNIQVMLSKTDAMAGVVTSEDLYLSNASGNVGYDCTVSDPYDINIAGEKYRAVDLEYSSYGTKQIIAAKKIGGDFVCIVVTVYSDLDSNDCSYYIDLFSKP